MGRIDIISSKILRAVALSLPLSLAAHGQTHPEVHLIPPNQPVPASLFGLHVHHPTQESWPQVQFSELRLWDTPGATWYQLEPQKGQWNFSQLDRYVALAQQNNVGMVLVLGQTPPWASSDPNAPPAWRHGGSAPPANEEDWKNYIRTVATRYKGRIHEYEVWNEPNLPQFYSGTREQLFTLAKDAYQIIHEIDATAIVVTPSITGWYGVGWLKHYLDLGAGQYADAIGYHLYTSPKSPEASLDIIEKIKAAMQANHIDKPLWDTESGYSIKNDLVPFTPESGSLSRLLSHEEAIAYVMRGFTLNWASGVSRMYWYDWDGGKMGLADASGKQQKPAAYAYATIERWLVGATLKTCDSDADQNWVCELDRGNRRQFIVWNGAENTVSKPIPAAWKVKQLETLSPLGQPISKTIGGDLLVSFAPIPSLLK